MSNWKIAYTKDHLAKAKEKGRTAFAVGFFDPDKDRGEAFMWLEDETATTLWLIAMGINRGLTPRVALEEAEAAIAKHKAKLAAKATGQAVTR